MGAPRPISSRMSQRTCHEHKWTSGNGIQELLLYIYMEDDAVSNLLNEAVVNEENENITSHTYASLEKCKRDIIAELFGCPDEQASILVKLEDYRHVDELPEFRPGCHVRWIRTTDGSTARLTNGGFLLDVSLRENGVHIRCRNGCNRIFQIRIDDVFVFQKLTDQERVILSMIDIINGDHE